MSNAELTSLSLVQAAGLVRSGKLSPVDLVQAHLRRIESLDPRLNAFITTTADSALEQARHAEKALADGEPLGPLHGLPLAFKDLYETQGVRTTAGSKLFSDNLPEADAVAVQKLYAAGAISLGKTNMHEIALGLTNVNPHYGACHNPWALDRVSGGSSGGSAAALAAGLCLGSLGSDTGGSIRVPAALCGIVGLKPTYGRVSLRGVIPLSWNLDHAGPMARRVEDIALLLQVIAGYDSLDPASIDAPVDDYLEGLHTGVRGWRIALLEGEYFNGVDHEVSQAVQTAAGVFEGLGAHVTLAQLPGIYQAALANGVMVVCDAAAYHYTRLQEHPQEFGGDVLQRLQMGASYPLAEYIRTRRTQVEARREFEAFFADYDLALLPAAAVVAPYIEGPDAVEQARRLTRFTAPFNLTGLPALSLPCGFSGEGLPVGLQLVAPPWAEARTLRAAYAYEQATTWHTRSPLL